MRQSSSATGLFKVKGKKIKKSLSCSVTLKGF